MLFKNKQNLFITNNLFESGMQNPISLSFPQHSTYHYFFNKAKKKKKNSKKILTVVDCIPTDSSSDDAEKSSVLQTHSLREFEQVGACFPFPEISFCMQLQAYESHLSVL